MEQWLKDLSDGIEAIIYSQWSAMGAFLTEEATRRSVLDPEALLVATCATGRDGPRIFDEMLDWLIRNERFASRFVRPVRLRTIAAGFEAKVSRVLAAAADYVSVNTGKDLFPAVKALGRESLQTAMEEDLFFSSKGRYGKASSVEPTFLRWKLLRGEPRIREHSGPPDMENPANIMTLMRKHYGSNVKADILTYLLTGGPGNSYSIAGKIKYNQSSVYREIERMVDDGLVSKYGEVYEKSRGGPYWVDPSRFSAILGLNQRELPVFFAWPDIYLAYHLVLSDWREHQEKYQKEFFQAERMRELSIKVVPLIREAGGPLAQLKVPEISEQKGLQHKDRLVSFLSEAMDILKRSA